MVDSIGSLLSSVLHWVEDEDEEEKWWQLQTRVAQLCLMELGLFNPETRIQFRERNTWHTEVIPNVRAMVDAMENRNRAAALASGKRAVVQLLSAEYE